MKSSLKHTKPNLKMIIASAIFGALLLAVQIALAFLPNIEIVTVLLLVIGCVMGPYSFISIAIFIFLEGLYFGFGIWWVSYLYIWAIPIVFSLIFKRVQNFLVFTAFAGFFGLIFGSLTAIPYLFIGGFEYMISYIISGIPYDLLHAAGNLVTTVVLFLPLRKALTKVVDKHLKA